MSMYEGFEKAVDYYCDYICPWNPIILNVPWFDVRVKDENTIYIYPRMDATYLPKDLSKKWAYKMWVTEDDYIHVKAFSRKYENKKYPLETVYGRI